MAYIQCCRSSLRLGLAAYGYGICLGLKKLSCLSLHHRSQHATNSSCHLSQCSYINLRLSVIYTQFWLTLPDSRPVCTFRADTLCFISSTDAVQTCKVECRGHLIYEATSSQKRSGIARVVRGSHSFACTPTRLSTNEIDQIYFCRLSRSW